MADLSIPNTFTNATAADAGEVNANFSAIASYLNTTGGMIKGDAGKYRLIAGTIRNTAGTWAIINDASHQPIGISGVTQGSDYVRLTFDTAASQVVTLVCGMDESYAEAGFTAGASVGLTYADLKMVRPAKTIGAYYSWTGSGFTGVGAVGGFAVSSFDTGTGKLTLSHDAIMNTMAHVSGRQDGHGVVLGAIGETTTEIYFRNKDTGAIVSGAGDSNMKAYVSRTQDRAVVSPADSVVTGANIWFIGLLEVP